MKKSCGMTVAVWLVLTGLYGAVAWTKTREAFPAAVIGILGGTFAAMLAGGAWGLVTGGEDRAALKRAIAGEPRRDGHREAATGRVRALGAALESPFTGRACVAYEYDVKSFDEKRSDFTGVALVPCVVDTAQGPAQIMGWSMLDEFPKALQEDVDRVRGLGYLRNTNFETLGFTNALSYVSSLVADQDGAIRRDMRIDHGTLDLEGRRIDEKVVPVGSTVTVIGIWSEAKRGFAPGLGASLNQLFPVSPVSVLTDVRTKAWKTFGIAVFFFVVLHAFLVPMYLLAPH